MSKIVTRDAGKWSEEGSFAAQPKTLYRLGKEKGRLEEALDSAQGLHNLFIVNGKDIWILNRVTKKGRHIIDTDATHNFHAPLIPPIKPDEPPPLGDFEIGHEVAFMTDHQVKPQTVQQEGKPVERYEYNQDGYFLQVDVSPEKGVPVSVRVLKDKEEVVHLIYVEYVTGLPADPSLFAPPADFKISEG